MGLSEWLLDVGSPGSPALVDCAGVLTRDELRAMAMARARELDDRSLPDAVALTQGPARQFVLDYLAALHSGRRVYLPQAIPRMPDAVPSTAPAAPRTFDHGQQAAVVMYTSGSTSAPSPVPLTTNNLIANGSAIVDALGIHDTDRTLCTLPFNYSFGLSLLHTALASGGCVILHGHTASVPDILHAVDTYEATIIGLVPTLARRLAKRLDAATTPGSLRMVQVAGGRLDVGSTRALAHTLDSHGSLQIMYGLTEATARVTTFDATRHPTKIGSCGQPVAGVTVHCEGPAGERVGAGQEGIVVVGGPGVCSMYARPDGLLQTGDHGFVDVDGFLWIQGRVGDFAKIGDARVSLAIIEDFLHSQPGVAHAVAIAIPDPVYTERVVALVVPGGCGTDATRLRDAAYNSLPRLLVPVRFEFVRDIPMTSNGKIDRLAANASAAGLAKD
jgi:long-chain acyl-CoA synthetase